MDFWCSVESLSFLRDSYREEADSLFRRYGPNHPRALYLFLKAEGIRDTIGSVFTAIVELPGRIATALIEGIKSLFIPSEEDLNGLKDKYEALLSERLGFIWQAGEWVTSFAGDFLTAITSGDEAEFIFPGAGFDMNGQHYQLIEEQPVDFSGNAIVQIMRPVFGTIVAFIVVTACVNLFHDMVTAFVSGKSYFDFLKGGGGE